MALPKKCPLCNAKAANIDVVTPHVFGRGKDSGYAFFHCNVCDIFFQFPFLSIHEENRFYAEEFENFMESRAGKTGGWKKVEEHIKVNEVTRQRRMKYLKPHLEGINDVLEVGCSSGFMLYPLRDTGYKCVGIEPSGVFSDFVIKNNLPIYDSLESLIEKSPNLKFDMIIHFFVLEHIQDPLLFLKRQLELLKPNGKIIFEVPNVNDPLYTVYDIPEFERFYWSLAHPWYFSERALNYVLSKLNCQFEIILDQRYDLSNHMIWARDGLPGGMGKFTDILGFEIEKNYKDNLIRIGKCDTLIAVVHKN